MEFLDNFQCIDHHENSSVEVSVLQCGKKKILYHNIINLEKSKVDAYMEYYSVFYSEYEKLTNYKRKLLLIYDLRNYNEDNESYYSKLKGVYPFASMHFSLRESYKTTLAATVIIITNPKMKDFFDTVFSTIYVPARPIQIVTEKELKCCLSNVYNLE